MYEHYIKRLFDIVIGIIGTLCFAFLFVFVAPIIFFTDRGPVFYNAERIGKNGKPFKMYKFRSMYVDAPDVRLADGSTYNGDDDPRVTKIGKLLRKTSLDEVPQFLNVLLGDMSIIGPRPTVPIDGFDINTIPDLEKMHYSVRPGITGYSQAFYRNSINQEEKFKNDAYYANNVSFWLDMKIFIKTVLSVLGRENIYNK